MVWLAVGKSTKCWLKLNTRTKGSGKKIMKWLVIILTGIFTGAKLASAINWSWWIVFSPVLIYYGLWVALFVFVGIFSFVKSFVEGFRKGYKDERNKHED